MNNLPILGVLCMYFCMRNKIFFKKMGRMLADSKKSRTFASLLKRSTSERKSWRDGRVVDRGGLENRCTERYRGFESLSLRQRGVNLDLHLFLYLYANRKKKNRATSRRCSSIKYTTRNTYFIRVQ